MTFNNTALTRAAQATIWFVVFLTIVGEESSGFKTWLSGVTGHHWVTKGVFSLILFLMVLFIFYRAKDSDNPEKQAWLVLASVILGSIAIFGFYIFHFFGLI